MSGHLFIISGPAGSGKTTICDRVLKTFPDTKRAITSTTRKPRGLEKDGLDYIFMTQEQFENSIEKGEFYEWAKVHLFYYGTLKSQVDKHLKAGNNILLNIDVQGASAWRELAKNDKNLADKLVDIFICPKDIEELKRRLTLRGEDSSEQTAQRLKNAVDEIEKSCLYKEIIYSKTKEEDFNAFLEIYKKYDSSC